MMDNKREQGGFTLGELILVFAFVGLLAAVLFPFIRHTLAKTDKVLCANNIREIGRSLYIYAREHEGNFPPTLNTLYDEKYLSDVKLLDCPANRNTGDLEYPDYIYTGGLNVNDASRKELLKDRKRNHPDRGRNILYLNGDIYWKP
ncbi:MAG: hypothetical protein GF408_01000 [Candidatus Omnitrophica bacterium]|nr:hypothetical protein [Candidatus Omnitrophota bacterium]